MTLLVIACALIPFVLILVGVIFLGSRFSTIRSDRMDSKPFWKSWTVWFNFLSGVYMAADAAGLIAALPAKYQAAILLIGNLLLRIKTSQSVSLKA